MKIIALHSFVPTPVAKRAVLAWAALGAAILISACARGGRADGDAIVVSGNIEVIDAQLAFKIPGRLVERAADEGDKITAGQLIARLDDVELTQQLDLRRAELAAAEAGLAELVAGSRPQEIAAAEATLRSAEAERDRAALEERRQRELHATNASSDRELETAQAQLRVAEAHANEARERLALVREGPRQEAIAQARARVAQAGAAVALAESQVGNARLIAPFSGVVIERHAEPGEFVSAGAPILTVADTSRVWLRAYVNQTDLGRIKRGQPVEVRTDSYPDKTYTGRLTFIADEAEFTPKTVQTAKERVTLVYRIKIDLDNASGELKPGMAADATIRPSAGAGN
jgi:HlyD family secretion protein